MESEVSLQRQKIDSFKGDFGQYSYLFYVLIQYSKIGDFAKRVSLEGW